MIRHFLQKLVPFKVESWVEDSDQPNQGPTRQVADLRDADVISSLLKVEGAPKIVADGRHIVVLDIDYPAALIPSETAGHFHLFLDVPGGIPQPKYMGLLKLLAELNVIEKGYFAAAWQRGHTAVRLPWVTKAESAPTTALPTETCTIASPLECHSPTNREQLEKLEMPF